MHYRNGRKAQNGDRVVQLDSGSSGKIAAVGSAPAGFVADTTTVPDEAAASAQFPHPVYRLPACVYAYRPLVAHPPRRRPRPARTASPSRGGSAPKRRETPAAPARCPAYRPRTARSAATVPATGLA